MCSSLPKPTHIPIKEDEKLKDIITWLDKENEDLNQILYRVASEKDDLKLKLSHREEELIKSQVTASEEIRKR